VLPENSQENIEKAKKMITESGKKAIVFSGEYHIYLNQILSCMVAHAIYLRESTGASVNEIKRRITGLYAVADAFDVLDSVGLGLMAGKPDSFRISRNKGLLEYSCGQMSKWIEEGCPREPLSFLDFMNGREQDSEKELGDLSLSMISLILNELVNALSDNESGDTALLIEAVQDTLGLSETPACYYKEYGADAIFAELERLSAVTGFGSYDHADKSVWDKYFNV
jgi:3-hydroxybutyryl-CoA dehydrogenase